MSVKATKKDDSLVIEITGTLNGQLQSTFRNSYKGIKDIKEYIIDLRLTEFADSAGLGLLLALYGITKSMPNKPIVKIINANNSVKDLLTMSKFQTFFTIE
ncbi:MAG: hypothetical protein HON94_12110 [Methylococcales bacterium]|jgi:anti-anti-sigma factor|nr:hypothetical protein [Methylococcales bacterium]MBT7409809.1 hypothetical protein [Methylococcales bacterium]